MLLRDGDRCRVIIDGCRRVDVAELIIPARAVSPGSVIIDCDKAPKEAYFTPVTYAGIDDCDIILRQDPGPTTRIPVRGVFSKYGIFDFRGVRIVLKIVDCDSLKVTVQSSHRCCRAHWR
jgi:hypothetical protein